MMSRKLLVANTVCFAILLGCDSDKPKSSDKPVSPPNARAAVELTVLVVDDPKLAEAVNLLRGEWAERSGGNLVVQETGWTDFETQEHVAGDVLIYPSSLLAELVARNYLRPVRESMLRDPAYAYEDLLPLIRNEVMRYGGKTFSISLGEAPLMLARPALSEDSEDKSRQGTLTWESLDEHHRNTLDGKDLVAELIARAAAYTDPQRRSELLFEAKTMRPRLSAEPMQRALSAMLAGAASDAKAPAFQIACPTNSFLEQSRGFVLSPLPPARDVYDSLREKWEPRKTGSAFAVLGFSGRMASVTASTRNATSAFKLLSWLGSGSASRELSSRSQYTVWFRNSQRRQSNRWMQLPRNDYLTPLITKILSEDDCYQLPRIPGIDQYVEILRKTLANSKQGSQVSVLLEEAAQNWEQLTDTLGRERQQQAYRYHLGLDTWSN